MCHKIKNITLKHSNWLDPLLTILWSLFLAILTMDIKSLPFNEESFIYITIEWLKPASIYISIVFAFLLFCTKTLVTRNRPQMHEIEQELEKANEKNRLVSEQVQNLFDGYLYRLGNKLGFGSMSDNNERISLYIHDDNKSFISCGRFSSNPKYTYPSSRSYSDNQGCIAKGWENGWYFDNQFPNPTLHQDDYYEYCSKNYSLSASVCKKLNMKSTLYAVQRIERDQKPFAVLVLESTDASRFEPDDMKNFLSEQNDFLSEMINNLHSYIPRPANASERGL